MQDAFESFVVLMQFGALLAVLANVLVYLLQDLI